MNTNCKPNFIAAALICAGFFTDSEAAAKGWTVVSLKDDWKTIFAFEKK
jgi:hypothetical protein